MKIKKFFFSIIFLFILFLIFNIPSYAGSQEWNSLNYEVYLKENGDADIIETWDIYVSETNTLFKDFELDNSKFSGFSNINVAEIDSNGSKHNLKQIFENQYHVDPGCYYGLKIDSSTFEIAWNVGLDNSSGNRTFEISYTIKDAVKVFNDCSEFYWMFLSTKNSIEGDNISGIIHLPKHVKELENLLIWAHGPLNGEINHESNDTVIFNLPHINNSTMLETRIVVKEDIFTECTNTYSSNKLDSILEEETKWANQANRERIITKIITTLFVVVTGALSIWLFTKIIKYLKAGKELKQYSYEKSNLKYFRDIPDNNATPGAGAWLYYLKNNKSAIETNLSKIFSATMLDLALKNFIEFETIDKNNIKIILKNNSDINSLPEDERLVYNFLQKAENKEKELSTKTLKKYCQKNYDNFHDVMKSLEKAIPRYHEQNKNIDEKRQELSDKWLSKGGTYILIIVLGVCFPVLVVLFPILIELIILAILAYKNSNTVSILSKKGNEEKNEWKALKNFMEDYSLLKEKEVPDLVLWEKYLVYATAFGISEKVIKQLKLAYPNITENTYTGSNYYFIHTMTYSHNGTDFINTLDHSFTSIYSSAASAYSSAHSSGSGGGGGFSGGGGGRRRRR